MSLALLCPGQGAQHPDMFARLRGQAAADAVLKQAASLLQAAPQSLAAGETRFDNAIAQPLVCAATLATWAALQPRLPKPILVLGYSVGELAAHGVAGSMTPQACLALAQARAACMDAASPADGGLLAVIGLSRRTIERLCDTHDLAVAIVNDEDHVVLGGREAGLRAIQRDADGFGARTVRLPVRVPAHTRWLAPAAKNFADTLAKAQLQAPVLDVLAGIDGHRLADRADVIDSLARQLAEPVEWRSVMTQAVERGARVFLELGPGTALARMARDGWAGCEARAVEEFQTLEGVAEWVEGARERVMH
ncbi:malonate decarboxylase subunit epsilon [Pseudoxanthomonas sp. JBR18]|uniref:malonate decarboxylase subunit epsilon n=1 Tax=Pseudoxanthomonas sp. JBR18 TaxID=2969308 RepID=UPI002305D534|nr:malonate decarboxylase subunit epsilon [Pseudoxanthomonas sp. JBR18]WCE02728.1 malonate decarboxylase subunit epsilon [Pseudoxanthomonas sp. JBR18]